MCQDVAQLDNKQFTVSMGPARRRRIFIIEQQNSGGAPREAFDDDIMQFPVPREHHHQ